MTPLVFPLLFAFTWLISHSFWPALGMSFAPLPLSLLIGLAIIQKQQNPWVIAWMILTILIDLFYSENPIFTAVVALICWIIGEVIIRSVLARRSYYATASYTAIMSLILVLSNLFWTRLSLFEIILLVIIFWLIMNVVSIFIPWKAISLKSQYEYE